jgi:hypothetical protein
MKTFNVNKIKGGKFEITDQDLGFLPDVVVQATVVKTQDDFVIMEYNGVKFAISILDYWKSYDDTVDAALSIVRKQDAARLWLKIKKPSVSDEMTFRAHFERGCQVVDCDDPTLEEPIVKRLCNMILAGINDVRYGIGLDRVVAPYNVNPIGHVYFVHRAYTSTAWYHANGKEVCIGSISDGNRYGWSMTPLSTKSLIQFIPSLRFYTPQGAEAAMPLPAPPTATNNTVDFGNEGEAVYF